MLGKIFEGTSHDGTGTALSMKLNAFIAHSGVCSRRKAVDLIQGGRVTINGTCVRTPAHEVEPSDVVKVGSRHVTMRTFVYIALNKPRACVTTVCDERGRHTVLDLLGANIKERVYPIGRLDRETTGLVLLTNDGELAYRLSHPRYNVSKVYHVTLENGLVEDDVTRITRGVRLADGLVAVDEVSFLSSDNRLRVRLVLHSGKKRVIRRLFEALGNRVRSLERTVYAGIPLGHLKAGSWRYLSVAELSSIRRLAGL